MWHLNYRYFYSCFLGNTRPTMAKTSSDFVFCFRRQSQSEEATLYSLSSLYILANLLGNESPWFVICDWWMSIRIVCFCVSRLVALCLKSTVSFTSVHRKFYLSSKCFNFFVLKRGKFRFQRWNCFYRACKSTGNTDTEGWKRAGSFPLTFTFADKHSGCCHNGLIAVAE